MTTTWVTAKVPAHDLVEGDRIDINGRAIALEWVQPLSPGRIVYGTLGRASNVDRNHPVTVHVPNRQVDGYTLWKPPPGTWAYSNCTCVHRRCADNSWEPIGRDCPACTAEITADWDD